MFKSWGHAVRRVFCCGSGANNRAPTNEPVYETLEELHQAHDAANSLRLMAESVDEIRRILLPIADVPERMRRLELNLHPLLVYRPEDGEYMEMRNGFRPAPAVVHRPLTPSVWQAWLIERVDYGEPW